MGWISYVNKEKIRLLKYVFACFFFYFCSESNQICDRNKLNLTREWCFFSFLWIVWKKLDISEKELRFVESLIFTLIKSIMFIPFVKVFVIFYSYLYPIKLYMRFKEKQDIEVLKTLIFLIQKYSGRNLMQFFSSY